MLGRILACLTTHLPLPLQLSDLLANGETPSRSPQAANYIAFSLLFLFILFMHLCKDCEDGFSAITLKGLKLHQKKCKSFLKHEAAVNECQKATANARRTSKLKDHKEHLGSAALGVRFL